jgi:Fe-S cluster assembly protein SufD
MERRISGTMTALAEEKDIYLADFAAFEKGLPPEVRGPLHRLRHGGAERFTALGFPTLHDEDWRFTNLAPLTRAPFQLAPERPPALASAEVESLTGPLPSGPRLVFVNGRFAPELSVRGALPAGVVLGSLAEALNEHRDKVEPHLAQYADHEEHPFIALNTAFLHDGAFLYLPKNVVLAEPVYLLFVATAVGAPTVAHPRNLIVAGVNSQARIVESYVGPDGDLTFTNAVTEVFAGENAVLDHYKPQREGRAAFHVATLQIQQQRSSTFSTHFIGLGGRLVRNEVNAVLGGEWCTCTLNGLYTARNEQHMDNRTLIDHAQPHCTSHELYKGILDGQAHGVFNGKILVRQDAQKTDAKQTNQTLLLSTDAIINTKPQLEIFADDVKCTHGATVGQLDAEAIFYLRSRGIDLQAARSLLTFAFANDIVGRIQVEPLRAQMEEALQLDRPEGKESV